MFILFPSIDLISKKLYSKEWQGNYLEYMNQDDLENLLKEYAEKCPLQKWLMNNTNLSEEQIIDFEMEFINK